MKTWKGCVPLARKWTAVEMAIIREHYQDERGKIVARLPGRSLIVVTSKARRMGVLALKRWTDIDEQRLRAMWGDEPLAAIAKTLGRTKIALTVRARELGLPVHCPKGWESVQACARRVGMHADALRNMLAWAEAQGIPERGYKFIRASYTGYRVGRHYRQFIVEAFEVDAAAAAWCKSEIVERAAAARGIDGKVLRRRLAAAGVARPAPRCAWRLKSEVIDAAIAGQQERRAA